MAAKLKRHQIQEYREAFDMFDLDGGGTISNEELTSVFRSLGQNPSREEVEEMLPNDQEMDFEQFLVLMSSKIQTNLSPDEVQEAFKVLDLDDDGLVDVQEMRGLLSVKVEKEVITREEAEALLARMQLVAGHRVEVIDGVVVPVEGGDEATETNASSWAVDDDDGDSDGGEDGEGGQGYALHAPVDNSVFIDFRLLVQYMMRVSGAQA